MTRGRLEVGGARQRYACQKGRAAAVAMNGKGL